MSDELGEKDEVYIQRYPGPGGRQRVSKDGGTEPVWSRDGHELFYRRGRQLFAVTIDTAPPQVVLGELRVVFDGPYELSAAEVGRPNYDVFPDGSFVMVRSEDKPPDRHVHVVLDWTEELKRLVPVK